MAYVSGSGWSDLVELQCLLIMKKLDSANFPWGMQKDLCVKLAEDLKKVGNPLTYDTLTIKVSEYKGVADHNISLTNSTNTKSLYAKYEKHSIEELELVISEMQAEV